MYQAINKTSHRLDAVAAVYRARPQSRVRSVCSGFDEDAILSPRIVVPGCHVSDGEEEASGRSSVQGSKARVGGGGSHGKHRPAAAPTRRRPLLFTFSSGSKEKVRSGRPPAAALQTGAVHVIIEVACADRAKRKKGCC